MSSVLTKAQVVTADVSPAATANTEMPLTQTPEGRLRVDAQLSTAPTIDIGNVEINASSEAGGVPSTSRLVSAAASDNSTLVKNAAGRVYAIQGYNAAASVRYLKLYNKATAPTVGTDTPRKTLALPPLSAFAFDFPVGLSFATGIGFGLVTGSADNSTAAVTAADIVGLNIDYA